MWNAASRMLNVVYQTHQRVKRKIYPVFSAHPHTHTPRYLHTHSSRPTFYFLLSTIGILCFAQHGLADLYSGRVYTQPRKIYVNQPFDIFLELEVSQGQDIDNIRIQGFPNDPSYINLGSLEQDKTRRNRRRADGKTADVLLFKAEARCHKSISQQFQPILSCEVVHRRSRGFFSFSSSSHKRIRLNPFTLTVRDLPSQGKPENYSGAVGQFSLNGSISKRDVRPGDLITLRLELSGKGWLNNAPPPVPPSSDLFKRYPPKETLRKDNLLETEQIFIPKSTDAVAIPPATFHFFNPETERYETCRSTEFRLNFLTTAAAVNTNEVMVINTSRNQLPVASGAVTINARQVNRALHKILPVIFACLTLLSSSFVFFILFRRNKAAAALLTLLTLAAGGFITFNSSGKQEIKELELRHSTTVYLAPSENSGQVAKLQSGSRVMPLEKTERWTRIEAEEISGWVENGVLMQ